MRSSVVTHVLSLSESPRRHSAWFSRGMGGSSSRVPLPQLLPFDLLQKDQKDHSMSPPPEWQRLRQRRSLAPRRIRSPTPQANKDFIISLWMLFLER